MSYKYTYICSWGSKASSVLYYSEGTKSGDPKNVNSPDAGGRVQVAGVVDGRDFLQNNIVEGQLFGKSLQPIRLSKGTQTRPVCGLSANAAVYSSACDLNPPDGRLGGSYTVYWMINPNAKDAKPDDRVGWGVAIQKGISNPPYTVVPVWRADGGDLGKTGRKRLYYFQNNYYDSKANL
jgi:hypothetical protein